MCVENVSSCIYPGEFEILRCIDDGYLYFGIIYLSDCRKVLRQGRVLFFNEFDEVFDDLGIESAAAFLEQNLDDLVVRHGLTIGAY